MTRTSLLGFLVALALSTAPALAGTWTTELRRAPAFPSRFDSTHCAKTVVVVNPQGSSRNDCDRSTLAHAGLRTGRPHSASCQCSPCNRGGRGSGDTTVVVVTNEGRGGDSVTVLREGRKRDDRGYGRSPSNDYGADFGLAWNAGSAQLGRAEVGAACRKEGQVLASSGTLYLQVRADGRLTIRSR